MKLRYSSSFQVPSHKVVFGDAQLQGRGAGVLDRRRAMLFHHREHAEDAADGWFALFAVDRVAEVADVRSGLFGPP